MKTAAQVAKKAYDDSEEALPFSKRDMEIAVEAQFKIMYKEIYKGDFVPAFRLKYLGFMLPNPNKALKYYTIHRKVMKQGKYDYDTLRKKAVWLLKVFRFFGGYKNMKLWKKPMNIRRHLYALLTVGSLQKARYR